MIEARHLTRTFPGVTAVQDLSFSVEKGQVVGFLGPNGAGKSTTMRMLTAYLPPTSGEAKVAGFDVTRDSLQVREKVGYLPEANPMYPDMRVTEYLSYRARLKGLDRRTRASRVEEVIRRCHIGEYQHRIIGHLSKGMRQRVGLADAIVHDPPVLILDEPTIGLDPNQIREMRQLIVELGRDKAVLLSSHILSEIELTCTKVIILVKGRVVAEGTAEEIARQLGTSGRIRLEVTGDGAEVKAALDKVPGVKRVLWNQKGTLHAYIVETKDRADLRGEIYELARRHQWKVQEIAFEHLSLEEAFARLTEQLAA
jgi:ABC-2 type transport system ATP-binding protein